MRSRSATPVASESKRVSNRCGLQFEGYCGGLTRRHRCAAPSGERAGLIAVAERQLDEQGQTSEHERYRYLLHIRFQMHQQRHHKGP